MNDFLRRDSWVDPRDGTRYSWVTSYVSPSMQLSIQVTVRRGDLKVVRTYRFTDSDAVVVGEPGCIQEALRRACRALDYEARLPQENNDKAIAHLVGMARKAAA